MATAPGEVLEVNPDDILVNEKRYKLAVQEREKEFDDKEFSLLPERRFWQEPMVKKGDTVEKKQLIAKGVSHIHFQANIWIFTGFAFVVGILMGIGKAAVYKHIPMYFPNEVGVVGGIVGVLGGLGGFFCPILFGYLLGWTGLWTTCWIFLFLVASACLVWMHHVIRKMLQQKAPELANQIDVPQSE